MWHRLTFLAGCAALLTAVGPAAGSDPAARGPFTPQRLEQSVPGTAGAALITDVYFPRAAAGVIDPAAGHCPVIVLGHGFSQSKDQHVNQGLHFASRGFIALVPNFNGGSDHSRNADDLVRCVDWILARDGDPASMFFQRVRRDRIGATGHSAGGLSAIVAASRDPRIRVLAPMDPVDNGGLGAAALAVLTVPVAITYSEPSSCNASGSAATLYTAARGHKRGIKIVGANHSEPQDPVGVLSTLVCGAANTNRQALYRRCVTGWFEYYLKADPAAAPWAFALPGSPLAADLAAGRITYAEVPPPSPVAEWRDIHFHTNATNATVSGPDADPDADTLSNLVEYALGLDPNEASTAGQPQASLVTTNGSAYLAVTFTRVTLATDVEYTVEASQDLATWQPGSSYAGTNSTPITPHTAEVSRSGLGLEQITVRDQTPAGAGSQRFLRLRVRLW